MGYDLSPLETRNIIENFGLPFYEKVKKDVVTYSDRWKLEILDMVDYYSVNCIFLCKSPLFGGAVLKISRPDEVLTEISALREYDGGKFCRLYGSDAENGVILEERIMPGTQLKQEKSLDKRLEVFVSLFRGLHIAPEKPEIYPTYTEWADRITEYMSRQEKHVDFYRYMKKAREVCAVVCSDYTSRMLLHGDFHYDNILLGGGEYRIIDPKGVVGDPVFDVPRYLLNEYDGMDEGLAPEERRRVMMSIICYFEKALNIPREVILRCFFIEMSMSACWVIESGGSPDIRDIIFAEELMNG